MTKHESIIDRLDNNNKEFEMGYLTGAIFGDGCLGHHGYRSNVYNSDVDYIGILCTIINDLFPKNSIHILNHNNGNSCFVSKKNCFSISINSKDFFMLLKPYKPKKYQYLPPEWLKTKNQKAGFIAGLFDTDGCVGKTNVGLNLTTKFKKNLIPIKKMLYHSFNISSYIRRIKSRYKSKNRFLYRLFIFGYLNIKKFKNKIGFLHPYKERLLLMLLKNRYVKEKRKLKEKPRIEKLYLNGLSVEDIQKETTLPRTTIICWLDESFPKRKKLKQYDSDVYFEVMNLFKKGWVCAKISKLMEIPKPTIENWLYEKQKPNSVRRMYND